MNDRQPARAGEAPGRPPRQSRSRRDPTVPLLLILAATPLLPAWVAIPAVMVLAAFLLWRRPPFREALAIGLGAAAAIAMLAAAWVLERRPALPAPGAQQVAAARYTALWSGLGAGADAAVAAVGAPPRDDAQGRWPVFRALGDVAARRPYTGQTLLLFDPDGAVVAWAGPGLLHEPAAESLLPAGAQYIQGFGSATLFVVRPLRPTPAAPAGGRAWRLVAGESFATDALPFEPPAGAPADAYRWSLLPPGAPLPAGTVRLLSPGAPAIAITEVGPRELSGPTVPRRVAALVLGLLLLALATMRGVGTAVLASTVVHGGTRSGAVAALSAAGAVAWAWAAVGSVPPVAILAVAGTAAALLAHLPRRTSGSPRLWGLMLGALAIVILGAFGRVVIATLGAPDLGRVLVGNLGEPTAPTAIILRLAGATLAFGLLYGASRLATAAGANPRPPSSSGSGAATSAEGWAWSSAALLLAAGSLHEWTAVAAALAMLGGAAAVVWMASTRPLRRPLSAGVALLLAALASASVWEALYRRDQRAATAAVAPLLGPPPAAEMAGFADEVAAHFARFDLATLAPLAATQLDRQDLAYRLWLDSPLARRNALSGLLVEGADGTRSAFGFGLPISTDGGQLADPGVWEALAVPGWEGTLLAGEARLFGAGEPFGVARYWLLPQPGFRLGGRETEDVRLVLVRGGPTRIGIEGLPATAAFALYGPDGRAYPGRSPWPEAPPLDPLLGTQGVSGAGAAAARVSTPDGQAWAWSTPAGAGRLALYLPVLSPRAGLDRAGTHALSVVLLLSIGAVIVLVLALPRAAFRDALRRTLRSYSQRLILVYSLLLLVPLLIAGALLVRRFESRLATEQRTRGEEALAAASRVLGEYLDTLPPGFGLDTAIDDRLLAWLARVIRHDVSLYWGSGVYASSRRELFTSGLLPKRIPGEVSARLGLLGYGIVARPRQVGETAYLEFYSHLTMPGFDSAAAGGQGLALSVPLLAQQEAAAAELESLRRRAILVTAGLFLLLVALGTRLARGFTTPIEELVRGTQRIAGGAAALGIRPAESELAALADAIDRMAAKIAEGREKLVREKQVVERVVESITAGVVSLDAKGRVLMANRVAAELIALEVGAPLVDSLRRDPRLGALAAFVAEAGSELRQTTVRLPSPAGADAGDASQQRDWTLVWAPVPGSGEPAALLVVEDSTEVLRGQRLAAWAEMARIIAHEIKNPLTPIRLSAEHMREVYRRDPERFAPVFERCTENILKQVEELRAIASEFSIYSHIPALQRAPGELSAMVRGVVEAYAAAPPPGVVVRWQGPLGAVPAHFDQRLLSRAVRNVLENAVRASAGGGQVDVRLQETPETATITVADRGPGVPPADLERIFDPYFSTHAGGTGLGLAIARRIIGEHGGRITARNLSPAAGGGFEVAITIPR